jgi:hypothetical protein
VQPLLPPDVQPLLMIVTKDRSPKMVSCTRLKGSFLNRIIKAPCMVGD